MGSVPHENTADGIRFKGLPLGGSRGHELTLTATLGEKQGDQHANNGDDDEQLHQSKRRA